MSSESSQALEALVRLSFGIQARLEHSAAEHDLTLQQMRVLGILRDREPTINELGAQMGLDKSSMSGLVTRAHRRGFVSRSRDAHDQRAVRVRLEDAGRSVAETATNRFESDMQAILGALTDEELAQWTALTVRLLAADAEERGVPLSFGEL